MNDLISRHAVNCIIDALFKNNNNTLVASPIVWGAFREIQNLPSVNNWIPCRERLPEITESGVSDMVLLCWSDGQRTVGAYQGNRTFIGQAWPMARDCRVTVTAWMPLPEPYKAEE